MHDLKKKGSVVTSFFDLRSSARFFSYLMSPSSRGLDNLRASFCSRSAIAPISHHRLNKRFVAENEAQIQIYVQSDEKVNHKSVRNLLSSFGDLRSFQRTKATDYPGYFCEFFDLRSASDAVNQLDNTFVDVKCVWCANQAGSLSPGLIP